MIIQFITKFDHYVFSDNLPEDHPNKPRDWLSKTLTKVSASISTEVAMTMGLEVSFLVSSFFTKEKLFSVDLREKT